MKDFQFYNIFPCNLGKEQLTAQDMIEYRDRTGHDIALYSLSLHPEGRPASRKAEIYTESYRRLKAALAGSGVKLGILIQSVLGHWPRVDKDEEPWTRSINIKGEAVRYCPLDPDFRNYIFQTVATLAKEAPVMFMGDDDIRGYSHDAECFCPLHVAKFNQMTGRSFTSDEMREAVCKCVPGDEIFNAFRQMQQEMVDGVGALIREAIDSVDPTIPGASCMPGEEMRFNNTVSKAFAAKGQKPIMRICNGHYGEKSAKYLPDIILQTQALRDAHKDIPCVIEESDTFPHCLYSKSAVSMNAKFCVSIMSDVCGGKIWLVNSRKYGIPVNRNYADIIAKYDGLYQELTRSVRGTRKSGIAVPLHKRFLKWHPLHPFACDEFFLEPASWGQRLFCTFGLPCYCTFDLDDDSIYAVAGENAVDRFSDEEIMTLLKGKLIVDGPAAVALCRRGFGKYLGVSAEYAAMTYRFEYNDLTGAQYSLDRQAEFPKLEITGSDVQVMCSFYYGAFPNSPDMAKVAPSTLVCRNELGGTVGVTAISVRDIYDYALLTDSRKAWLTAFVDMVNGEALPHVSADAQDIAVMTRLAPDGSTIAAVFNQNFDALEKVSFRDNGTVGGIQCLTPDGRWTEAKFTREEDRLVIDSRLECYHFLVLKFS